MAHAIERHDALLQEAIAAHDGYVFKQMGDAFCAAFRTAPEAIAAACDAQRALSKEDFNAVDGLKVRMAVHVGQADEQNGDYFGPTVNRVARLLAIGYGGQVLVSGAAADLAQGEMPGQTALRDLGLHRLKDLAHPEQVYQLVAPDLAQKFFPLRSLDALPIVLACAIQHLGTIAAMRGDHRRAALLVGFTNTLFTSSIPREVTEQREYERTMSAIESALGKAQADELLKRGETMTQDQAVSEALSI